MFLPIELCATREVSSLVSLPHSTLFANIQQLLDNLLKLYFANRAGESFVERGDYDITVSDDISHIAPIKSAQWGDVVKPGTALAMNAILRREKKRLCYCPCCSWVIESGSMEPGSSIKWLVEPISFIVMYRGSCLSQHILHRLAHCFSN